MATVKYQLKRSLSVRFNQDTLALEVGWNSSNALTIENPPVYLATMLEILSTPHTLNDLLQKIEFKYPDFNLEEVKEVFNDLIKIKVIEPQRYASRYHRHELYFDFFDVQPEEYQKTLSTKKVGLIGSGGIGSTSALLLAAAGIGTMVLLDNDFLEESNLTRTILFEESDIATKKVITAKKRLEARNRHTTVLPIAEECLGAESIKKHLSDCDVWLLSADSPLYEIHQWTNEASLALGIPYINAGYIETFGAVGPFFIPGVTGCNNCNLLNSENIESAYIELNHSFQAPSYGPLNALVSSMAVNEIIRYLLGLDIKSLGTRLLIDSASYKVTSIALLKHKNCYCHQISC